MIYACKIELGWSGQTNQVQLAKAAIPRPTHRAQGFYWT